MGYLQALSYGFGVETPPIAEPVPPPPRYACRYADGTEFDLTEEEFNDTGCTPTNNDISLRSIYDLQTGTTVQSFPVQPGDPDFVGPTQQAPQKTPWYTLPVEVFEQTLPKIIQPGGVPTIPYPIPTTLPPYPGGPLQPIGTGSYAPIIAGVVILLAVLSMGGGRRKA